MNIVRLKTQRSIRQWQSQMSSQSIGDLYNGVKTVKVSVQITFNSGALQNPCIKEWTCCMVPADRLYLHHECINKDCTGDGFDLTSALRNALESRTCVEGEMRCTGKEDWKYLKSSGCSCSTDLKYKIEPEFY